MKVTTEQALATVKRIARIADGPVVKCDGYQRRFRVEFIEITYTWKDGQFGLQSSFDIKMGGQYVKADGTDAKDRAFAMRPDVVNYSSGQFTPQFEFVRAIVDLLRPGTDLSMTVLYEHEVGA